ncbi:MAG TPA: acyl-ACP desaturase [Blastocatellia bacterium]|nr:acyl-ACP desaturase [Blastocatellia bacterium]
MKTEFDLERYLNNSKAIDTSDINWDDVTKYPIDPGEIRCLQYMMDIESYTIMYLRDLLNTDASKDSEVASFLACWLYEETYHGLALEKFVRAAGVPVGSQRVQKLGEGRRFMESLETIVTLAISKVTRHFVAAHMTWGAIQELTTLSGYSLLASKTKNPILATILRRIVLDESRHFSFYYIQAAKRLTNRGAQKLTSLLLRKFWSPVGAAVKPLDDVQFLMSYIFAGVEGESAAKRVDRTISRLPGLGWFDLLESARAEYLGIQKPWSVVGKQWSGVSGQGSVISCQ